MSKGPVKYWFSARLLFQSHVAGKWHSAVEMRTVLLYAFSHDEACRCAQNFLNVEPCFYCNDKGDAVAWIGREVLEVSQLNDLKIEHGVEVDWDFFDNYELFAAWKNRKMGDNPSPPENFGNW